MEIRSSRIIVLFLGVFFISCDNDYTPTMTFVFENNSNTEIKNLVLFQTSFINNKLRKTRLYQTGILNQNQKKSIDINFTGSTNGIFDSNSLHIRSAEPINGLDSIPLNSIIVAGKVNKCNNKVLLTILPEGVKLIYR